MSLDRQMVTAFGDELTKIAVLKTLGRWASKGWHDFGGAASGKTVRGGGWLGKQVNKQGLPSWQRNVPIGGKSLMAAGTAAMVPGAVKKQDPLGQERSRFERVTDLGADIAGGVIGAGAALSLPGKKPWNLARSIIGGFGGSMLASHAAATPWRKARERARRPVFTGQERQQLMQNVMR